MIKVEIDCMSGRPNPTYWIEKDKCIRDLINKYHRAYNSLFRYSPRLGFRGVIVYGDKPYYPGNYDHLQQAVIDALPPELKKLCKD